MTETANGSIHTLPEIWGYKEAAFFDVWSIEHIAMGIAITSIVCAFKQSARYGHVFPNQYGVVFCVLLFSFAWEATEHYMETGLWE